MATIDVEASSDRFRWKRWLIGFFLFAVVAGLGAAGWCVYLGISDSLHAEMGLHATIGTVEAVEDFVRKHDGAWPRSWGELEQTSPQIRDAYGFTDGRAKIEEFVSIDFNANPDQLMKQSEEEFDAIKPVGPSYGSYRYHLPSLLAALRETRRPHSIDSSHPGSGRR